MVAAVVEASTVAVAEAGSMVAAVVEASTVAAVVSMGEASAEAAGTRVTAHREAALTGAGATEPACREVGSMAADSEAEPPRMDSVPVGLQALIDLPGRRGAQ
jgi:hypothetical protein